jgi:hypothetical protein
MSSLRPDPLNVSRELCRDASELRAAARDTVKHSKEALERSRRLVAEINERKRKKIAQPIT